MSKRDLSLITPLYFEMIVNQYPEASQLLDNIVKQCRYQHHGGMAFNLDDYHCFTEDQTLKIIIENVVNQAAELHELQTLLRDYSESTANLATQNPELLQNGRIDYEAVKKQCLEGLDAYHDAVKIFQDNIALYQQWLNENKDHILQHEAMVAQAMKQKLAKPCSPQTAVKWVNTYHKDASPEEKKAKAKSYIQSKNQQRKELASLYAQPQAQRKQSLNNYYSKEK